jgi:hypothetical protein
MRILALPMMTWVLCAALAAVNVVPTPRQELAQLPSAPLQYGFFTITFGSDGALTIEGKEWPALKGTWKAENGVLIVVTTGGPQGCDTPARYRYRLEATQVSLSRSQHP